MMFLQLAVKMLPLTFTEPASQEPMKLSKGAAVAVRAKRMVETFMVTDGRR